MNIKLNMNIDAKMLKRKSPREIIEFVVRPDLEEAWIKLPRKKLVPRGFKRSQHKVISIPIARNYMGLHTHPNLETINRYPSVQDMLNFLDDEYERSAVIAQTNPKEGKLLGYFVVRKTKKTKKFSFLDRKIFSIESLLNAESYGLYKGFSFPMILIDLGEEKDSVNYLKNLEGFMKKYHLQHKYLPVRERNKV